MKGHPFNIRLESELKTRVEQLAEEEGRSLASMIEYLVRIGLREVELKNKIYSDYKLDSNSAKDCVG